MEIGGAERSLLGLLNALDTKKYTVDLFVHQHTGEFMPLLPKKINLLPENKKYSTLERPIKNILKEGYVDIVAARMWAKFQTKIYQKKTKALNDASAFQFIADATTPLLPSLDGLGEYDLAISFVTPHNIVLKKVKAKRKIAWIHTDYSTICVNAKMELPVWEQYDYIASISDGVTKAFLKTFPTLQDKIVLIENILSPAFVREQASLLDVSSEMPNKQREIKLLSVGRYSIPKNFDNIPAICKLIVKSGTKVRWYIMGYGGDEALIKRKIVEANMQQHVILLGKKSNPYPYIQACDIYVQPSRYEGKAVTVREAQMLYKPVVITNFPTAKSQLTNGIDGVIVPLDNEDAAKGIIQLIRNLYLQKQLTTNLRKGDYGNENEVNKIYQLINEYDTKKNSLLLAQ
jgi:glycosyltransferase involved in cell wall biosynthesis